MLTVEKLTLSQMEEVYHTDMEKDFPESELKPFAQIAELFEQGNYEGYGFFEHGTRMAYAFFSKGNLGNYVLLDYLAVCGHCRSKGYGSQILPLLQETMKAYDGILGEVETPEFGHDETEKAVRERRMRYYHRFGFADTGLYCTLFGEHLSIICWGEEKVEDSAIYQAMDDIYRVMFNKKVYPGQVTLDYLEK
ncbi:MAG: N-acetyltransferase [bacterium]|nr:N-acetyltransferase [bacterium]